MASTPASMGHGDLEGQLAHIWISQTYNHYMVVAMACWCVWDHVITIDEEVELVWQSRGLNLIKVLFLAIRYGITIGYPISIYEAFASADTPNICTVSLVFLLEYVVLGHLIQAILCLRVWALCNRDRWIGVLLLMGYVAVIAVGIQLSYRYITAGQLKLPPVTPSLSGCLKHSIPNYYQSFLASLVLETVVVLLTIWKYVEHLRKDRRIPLVGYLLSSGLSYYLAMLGIIVINLLTKPFPILQVPVLSSSCLLLVQGIACNRIVLGLLRHGKKAEEWARMRTGQPTEKEESARGFFTIPSEIYSKEMVLEWEIGLPSLELVSEEGVPNVESA
ncbi:hypothetical protein CPB86DRAFT_826794 [Serendipita vermifera]|nr:hypothetical protein CPB86DRAFT_826794 [Serendipita vermifera]